MAFNTSRLGQVGLNLSAHAVPFVNINAIVNGFVGNLEDFFSSIGCQTMVYKVLVHLAWLSKFSDENVRKDFLDGKIGRFGQPEMLSAIDRIRELVLPCPAPGTVFASAIRGLNFMIGFFRLHDSQPLDVFGRLLPVRFTFKQWYQYLAELSVSDYWGWYTTSGDGIPTTGIPPTRDHIVDNLNPVGGGPTTANNPELPINLGDLPPNPTPGGRCCRDMSSEHLKTDHLQGANCGNLTASTTSGVLGGTGSHTPPRHPSQSSSPDWRVLLAQLSKKEAIEPPIFNGLDGKSIEVFFDDFEEYFQVKFAGNERQQSRVLLRFLDGPAKQAYAANDGENSLYSQVKAGLLRWYQADRMSTTSRSLKDFKSAHMSPGESLHLYGMRLEMLAAKAFPDSLTDLDRNLRQQFRSSVPAHFQQILNNNRRNTAMNGQLRELKWTEIMDLAKAEDRIQREEQDLKPKHSPGVEDPIADIYYTRLPPNVSSTPSLPSQVAASGASAKLKGGIWSGASKPLAPKALMTASGKNNEQTGAHQQSSAPGLPPRLGNQGQFKPNNTGETPPGKTEVQPGGQGYHRAPPSMVSNAIQVVERCAWCNRQRHTADSCWIRQGLCPNCGGNHSKYNCTRFPQPQNTVLCCPVCQGPHLGMNCPDKPALNA